MLEGRFRKYLRIQKICNSSIKLALSKLLGTILGI